MEKGGRAEEIVGMRECVLGRAGASQLGAERERGGEGEGERGSEISKIVQDQAGKIIDTRPKFNTNYSIKVKEKNLLSISPAVPTRSSPLFCFAFILRTADHIQVKREGSLKKKIKKIKK